MHQTNEGGTTTSSLHRSCVPQAAIAFVSLEDVWMLKSFTPSVGSFIECASALLSKYISLLPNVVRFAAAFEHVFAIPLVLVSPHADW